MFGNFTNTYASQELGLSTGGPSGSSDNGGDGRQSSHWRDDLLSANRPFIGIMDQTLGNSVRRTITENDIRTIDLLGYSVVFDPARPSNDSFANAAVVAGASGSAQGDSTWATREVGEPSTQAGFTGDKSVWFAWTAPATGTATFDTEGSSFDTTLGVYTGSSLNTLTACSGCQNDDAYSATRSSRASFDTTAGTVYYIDVDGWSGAYGAVRLNWTSTITHPAEGYSVTGRVVDAAGNAVAGVRVALDGPNLVNTFPALPATTDAGGNFSWSLLTPGGSYAVRSDDSRYSFSPATAVFNNISSNQTVTFTASPLNVSVTGRVVEGAQGLAFVFVGLYDNDGALLQQTTTGTDGRWTFASVGVSRDYALSFVKSGYTLTPDGFPIRVNSSALDVGNVTAVKANPIEETSFFVAQHYRDFLGREADASGLQFWIGEIENCGVDRGCREVKRINVSAAFFLSIEFQQTGSLVYKMHKAGFGDLAGKAVAVRRADFIADTRAVGGTPAQVIVGQGSWQAQLEANKQAFALAFVQRAPFQSAHGGQAAGTYVDSLYANAGVIPTAAERSAAVATFGAGGTAGQAAALRSVAESDSVSAKARNESFVLMQYFGYLQRDPDDEGFNFWLGKLNEFQGNFIQAEMVKAFLDSIEYRQRFGQ
jgi:hypothetical protein